MTDKKTGTRVIDDSQDEPFKMVNGKIVANNPPGKQKKQKKQK